MNPRDNDGNKRFECWNMNSRVSINIILVISGIIVPSVENGVKNDIRLIFRVPPPGVPPLSWVIVKIIGCGRAPKPSPRVWNILPKYVMFCLLFVYSLWCVWCWCCCCRNEWIIVIVIRTELNELICITVMKKKGKYNQHPFLTNVFTHQKQNRKTLPHTHRLKDEPIIPKLTWSATSNTVLCVWWKEEGASRRSWSLIWSRVFCVPQHSVFGCFDTFYICFRKVDYMLAWTNRILGKRKKIGTHEISTYPNHKNRHTDR